MGLCGVGGSESRAANVGRCKDNYEIKVRRLVADHLKWGIEKTRDKYGTLNKLLEFIAQNPDSFDLNTACESDDPERPCTRRLVSRGNYKCTPPELPTSPQQSPQAVIRASSPKPNPRAAADEWERNMHVQGAHRDPRPNPNSNLGIYTA